MILFVSCKNIYTFIYLYLLQLSASIVSSSTNSSLPENTKPEDREEEDKSREAAVEAAIALLNGDINTRLQGVDPGLQSDVDNILM